MVDGLQAFLIRKIKGSSRFSLCFSTRKETKWQRARKSLFVFAGFLIPLSILGYWIWTSSPDAPFILPSLMLSLSPAIASVLTRLVMREGFQDVSFRLHGPRMGSAFLLAFLFPFVIGTLSYGFIYLLGLAEFDPPPFPVAVGSPLGQFAAILAFSLVGILLLLIPDAGEEIGWRGYLLPRMIDARLPQPILFSSFIWGIWHLPVVFSGVYAVSSSRLISAVGLIIATLAFGTLLSWLRLGTGSVWPCVVAHAAWNSVINGGFTFATHNASENIWVGETGIVVAVTLVLAVWILGRSWKPADPYTG